MIKSNVRNLGQSIIEVEINADAINIVELENEEERAGLINDITSLLLQLKQLDHKKLWDELMKEIESL